MPGEVPKLEEKSPLADAKLPLRCHWTIDCRETREIRRVAWQDLHEKRLACFKQFPDNKQFMTNDAFAHHLILDRVSKGCYSQSGVDVLARQRFRSLDFFCLCHHHHCSKDSLI